MNVALTTITFLLIIATAIVLIARRPEERRLWLTMIGAILAVVVCAGVILAL